MTKQKNVRNAKWIKPGMMSCRANSGRLTPIRVGADYDEKRTKMVIRGKKERQKCWKIDSKKSMQKCKNVNAEKIH